MAETQWNTPGELNLGRGLPGALPSTVCFQCPKGALSLNLCYKFKVINKVSQFYSLTFFEFQLSLQISFCLYI